MRDIGGYFEIEFSNLRPGSLHPAAITLNSGRNALEYILRSRGYRKIYLPYYTCDAVLEPVNALGIAYEFYSINDQLEPVAIPECGEGEVFLYTNYFGLKDAYIRQALKGQEASLIIDNSQVLFSLPVSGADTFYSLRKFAGVPDGAFLYCDGPAVDIAEGDSTSRVSHLYQRKDRNANAGYGEFRVNDASLCGMPLTAMSASTAAFLQGYDFEKNKAIRERNFLFLHQHLGTQNGLTFKIDAHLQGPLCYPFLTSDASLRGRLIANHIFVAAYWPNVRECAAGHSLETQLAECLLPLPVDQRYSLDDMQTIVSAIQQQN